MIRIDLEKHKRQAASKRKENKKLFRRLKSVKPKELDSHFHELHDKVFSKIDCLGCANCCKTTGPLFTQSDINRISKYLGLKPAQFIAEYLREDEDNDMVLQSTPCTFLDDKNYCSIYDIRPKACREYPHTDRFKMHQILELTRKNVEVCPAVYEITEELKSRF